jgi:DNA modification methylase
MARAADDLYAQSIGWFAGSPDAPCSIVEGDARDLSRWGDETFDFAFTSPPYVNVIDYSRALRLSFYWLGYDLVRSEELEIGARCKRFRACAVDGYSSDLRQSFAELARVLRAGAPACIVVGDPTRRKARHELVERVRAILEDSGLRIESDDLRRRISSQRIGARSVETETLLIARRV